MFIVTLDGNYLHHPNLPNIQIYDAILELEVNRTGGFEFTIYPNHPLYSNIKRLKSIVEVYQDGELMFRGRPLNDTLGLHREIEIVCEGTLAYFNDSVSTTYTYNGSVIGYLQMLVSMHNAQVELDKRFEVGTVTVTDPNNTIVRSSKEPIRLWEELKNKTVGSSLGGYLMVRRLGGKNYLDYLNDSQYQSSQVIELTENMIDFSQEIKADDIVTVLIPLGAKLKDEAGNETDVRLNITSVNDGRNHIEHLQGISKWGRIWGFQIWDDVTVPSILKSKAEASLQSLVDLDVSVKIKAIDLSLIKNVDSLKFFKYVRVKSEAHDIDELMLIKKKTINLSNPTQNTIELGVNYDSFLDRQVRTDNIIKIIESNYVLNDPLFNIKNNQVIYKSLIQQNADNITAQVERIDENEIDIANLKIKADSIAMEVSALGGGNIISNILGTYGTMDWTFGSIPWEFKNASPYVEFNQGVQFFNTDQPIMYSVDTDTLSTLGFRVFKNGRALSKPSRAEGGAKYSLYTKYKGTGTLTFKLREYPVEEPIDKFSFSKETILGTTTITSAWATLTETITTEKTTKSLVLVVESDVDIYSKEYAIFTDSSVNMGNPRPYSESLTDINTKAEYAVTVAELTAEGFSVLNTQVNNIDGRVINTESSLNIQSDLIASKVSKDGVVSSINQTSESIKINASRVELGGYVTFTNIGTAGQTAINGGNITTGTISADRIGAKTITGQKLADGTIGALQISASAITAEKLNVTNLSSISSNLGAISGGSININGNFTVSSSGVVVAKSITTTGTHSGTTSGTVNSSSGTLGGNSYYRTTSGFTQINNLSTSSLYSSNIASLGTDSSGSNLAISTPGTGRAYQWVNTSDIRFKDDFKDVHGEFNQFIYSLPIGTYFYKGETEKRSIGINANFVDKMLPKELTQYIIDQDQTGYYSANYIALVPMLVKVVQEQNSRLIDLEYEISKLKGGIS